MISDQMPTRPEQAEPFRQGTVLTFNTGTGANTVSVAGGVLTNVPILESSGVVNLAAGDTVVLLKMRSSWAIMGKIVVAGTGDFAAAAVAFTQEQQGAADNFATINGVQTIAGAGLTLVVPAWATEALVTATATVSILNNSGAARPIAAGVLIDGVGGAFGSSTTIPNTNQGTSSTTRSRIITSPVSPLIIVAQVTCTAVIAAAAANQCATTATAIFRRT